MLKQTLCGLGLLVTFAVAGWYDLASAQTWQPSNPTLCLPHPSSVGSIVAGPEVIAPRRGNGQSHNVASALRLARFPHDLSQIRVYCNVGRKPCEDYKCFDLHISGIGIKEQSDGTARIYVTAWKDNRDFGKDYSIQMFANLPEGGVLGPMP